MYSSINDIVIDAANLNYRKIKTIKGEDIEEKETVLNRTKKILKVNLMDIMKLPERSVELSNLVDKYMNMEQITYMNMYVLANVIKYFEDGADETRFIDLYIKITEHVLGLDLKTTKTGKRKNVKASNDQVNLKMTVIRYIEAVTIFNNILNGV